MTRAIHFFNSATGRLARIVLGVALLWYGLAVLGGLGGAVLAIFGLVPIGLGIWGRCLLELLAPRAAQTA